MFAQTARWQRASAAVVRQCKVSRLDRLDWKVQGGHRGRYYRSPFKFVWDYCTKKIFQIFCLNCIGKEFYRGDETEDDEIDDWPFCKGVVDNIENPAGHSEQVSQILNLACRLGAAQ